MPVKGLAMTRGGFINGAGFVPDEDGHIVDIFRNAGAGELLFTFMSTFISMSAYEYGYEGKEADRRARK
jgi:hypothetical protein